MGSAINIVMTGDEARAFKAMKALIDQQAQFVAGTERISKSTREAGQAQEEAFGPAMLGKLAAYGGSLIGIQQAIAKIGEGYRDWREHIHEVAEASSQAQKDIVAFAALQEGGTKAARVQQATALAARYGVSDRAVAFDVAQSLQSAAETADESMTREQAWRQALQDSAEVFKLIQLGVSPKSAADAAIQATAQHVDVGSFLRKVYLAGEAGTRKPEDVAAAAKGMAFWDDKDLASAAAAVISAEQAKTGGEGETEVYLRQAGRALSGIGDLANKRFWQRHGLSADASQEERLAKLAELGIDTPEEIQKAGIGDVREIKGVQTLVKNFTALRSIRERIAAEDRPGLLEARRSAVESELPAARMQRELDILKVMQADAYALPEDTEALEAENLARARALALRRMRLRGNLLGGRFEDENGLVGPAAWWRATNLGAGAFARVYSDDDFSTVRERMRDLGLGSGEPGARDVNQVLNVEVERILSELRENAGLMARAAETFARTAQRPSTLARPNEDQ